MTTTRIEELETSREWHEAFPVMSQLRTHLDEETFVDSVAELATDGYRLFALRIDGEIVTLAGVIVRTNLYYGRHLWVHELVTDANHRSRGYGAQMLAYLEEWARERECELLALSSGVQRHDAHRFYEETVGMDKASYIYKQPLE